MIHFTPFPTLETKRLRLRRMAQSDVEAFYDMRCAPEMHLHTDTKADQSLDETRAYIDKMNQGINEDKWLIWAIEVMETGIVIGSISIWNINLETMTAELGYGIAPSYQGQGFMKEALDCVTAFGLEVMGLAALEAFTEKDNVPSVRLLEKCQFVKTGEVDDEGYFSDRIFHMWIYRKTKQEVL